MRVHRKAWALLGIATGWAALTLFTLGLRLEEELVQSMRLIGLVHMLGATFLTISLACIFSHERHRAMQLLAVVMLFGATSTLGHIEHYQGIVLRYQCTAEADWRLCVRAAKYHSERDEYEIHRDAAERFWARACTHGAPWESCRRAADAVDFDLFCERSLEACNQGVEEACVATPLGCENDVQKHDALACRDGDREACYEAGRVLEERDPERARSYILRACQGADSTEELKACFELVDRGHHDSRRIACQQIRQECHFHPSQSCRAYVERCQIVTRSPYDRRPVRIAH